MESPTSAVAAAGSSHRRQQSLRPRSTNFAMNRPAGHICRTAVMRLSRVCWSGLVEPDNLPECRIQLRVKRFVRGRAGRQQPRSGLVNAMSVTHIVQESLNFLWRSDIDNDASERPTSRMGSLHITGVPSGLVQHKGHMTNLLHTHTHTIAPQLTDCRRLHLQELIYIKTIKPKRTIACAKANPALEFQTQQNHTR